MSVFAGGLAVEFRSRFFKQFPLDFLPLAFNYTGTCVTLLLFPFTLFESFSQGLVTMSVPARRMSPPPFFDCSIAGVVWASCETVCSVPDPFSVRFLSLPPPP